MRYPYFYSLFITLNSYIFCWSNSKHLKKLFSSWYNVINSNLILFKKNYIDENSVKFNFCKNIEILIFKCSEKKKKYQNSKLTEQMCLEP